MIIFLDVDGVLHSNCAAGRELRKRDATSLASLTEHERRFIDDEGRLIVGKNLFCHAVRLANTLQPFPTVQIVISSTWRNYFSLEKLKSFLPPTLADRVIGVTPNVFSRDGAFIRSREILAYLSACNRGEWLAIDDESSKFYDYSANPNLILCDGEQGFDDAVADNLRARIASIFTARENK